jgi:hypothetical protein
VNGDGGKQAGGQVSQANHGRIIARAEKNGSYSFYERRTVRLHPPSSAINVPPVTTKPERNNHEYSVSHLYLRFLAAAIYLWRWTNRWCCQLAVVAWRRGRQRHRQRDEPAAGMV